MQQEGTTDGQLGLRDGIKLLKAGQGGVGMAAFCQCLRQGLALELMVDACQATGAQAPQPDHRQTLAQALAEQGHVDTH